MLDSMDGRDGMMRSADRLGIPDDFGLGPLVAALSAETEDELELDDRVRGMIEARRESARAFGEPDRLRFEN